MTAAVGAAVSSSSCAATDPRVARLNAGKSDLAKIDYEGDVQFGPAMRVKRYRMGNGLKVLLLIDRGAPVVSYHTWFRVGSRDEKPGKTGLAHLFEHLMFNETTHLAAGEFDRTLEENGAESNAATWLDWTMYHENLPAPKLGLAVKLESDRMANLVLRDKQVFEREGSRGQRASAIASTTTSKGSVNELLYQTAFEKHPYHWPTIGWMKDIEAFTTEDCEAFYKTFYAPNNATVVIVGDVVEDDALALVQSAYGALPPSQLPMRIYPEEPVQANERRLEIKKPTATEKVMFGYKGPNLVSADHAALTVLNEVLFGGRSSRMYRALVKKQEVATDIRGWVGTFADPGLYEIYLTAREKHTCEDLEKALHAQLELACTKEITNDELEKAKSRLELGFLQGMETVSGKAEQIGFYDTVLGDAGAGFARLELYRTVTAEDVLRVAKTYLVDAHRTVIRVLPDGTAGTAEEDEEEGDDDDDEGATANAKALPNNEARGRSPMSRTPRTLLSGLALSAMGAHLLSHTPTEASAAPITSATASTVPAARPRKLDVEGGAVVYLVESHELPLVDISIAFRTGSAIDAKDKLGSTRMFARMLRRGAEGWSGDLIEESIDRYGGEISMDVSPSTITMHIQVIRRNLEPFMKLVTALLTKPLFPEDELARLKRETVAEIIEARDSDKALASKFFRRAIFGDHAYGRGSGTTKTVPTITREDVVAAHAAHIRRGNVVLGISGDVTEADVKSLILPLVAAFPAGKGPADPTVDPVMPKGRRLFFVDKPARTQTQILIGGLGTHANDADHTALHLANTVFGGTFTARLMKEVRSKRGWSYGAYSRMPIDRKREAFSVWTFPAAGDAAACLALEMTLLDDWVKDGITDAELGFAKSYLTESYAFDIDTPFKRVRQAVDEELYGLPADYHTGYVSHVLGVPLASANQAIKSRIHLDDLVVVVVGTASEIKDAVEKAIPGLASTEVIPFEQE